MEGIWGAGIGGKAYAVVRNEVEEVKSRMLGSENCMLMGWVEEEYSLVTASHMEEQKQEDSILKKIVRVSGNLKQFDLNLAAGRRETYLTCGYQAVAHGQLSEHDSQALLRPQKARTISSG